MNRILAWESGTYATVICNRWCCGNYYYILFPHEELHEQCLTILDSFDQCLNFLTIVTNMQGMILYYFFWNTFKLCSSNGFLFSFWNHASCKYNIQMVSEKFECFNTSCHYSSLFPDWNSSGLVSLMSDRIVSGRPFWSNLCWSTATVDSVLNVGAVRKYDTKLITKLTSLQRYEINLPKSQAWMLLRWSG